MRNDIPPEAVVVVVIAVAACLIGNRLQLRKRGVRDSLDVALMTWSPEDPYTVRDLLNGGCVILGRTGSGKTSGSGRSLLKSIVANRKSGGLLLAAKPEDADFYRQIFSGAGRSDDLLVVNPDGELRCNFLDYVRQMGGDTREITRFICTVSECLRQSDTGGGEDRQYWESQQERMIFNGVEVVGLGLGKVTAPELMKFIAGCAGSAEVVGNNDWRKRVHYQTLLKAEQAPKTKRQEHDFDLASDYWMEEIPTLNHRTRTSIQVGVMQTLHVFNTGIVREMVSADTNCSPDDILNGRWVLVNMPPSKFGDSGRFVNAGWKYLVQKSVLRRKAEVDGSFVVIWCDEAQQFVNSHDAAYLAQCRSHLGCEVFLTQSLHSLYSELKGETGQQQAMALLSNFSTRIFHALGDEGDAKYASGLIGRERQQFMGGSVQPVDEWIDMMLGVTRHSASFSEHYENIVQPQEFLYGLRCGGKESGYCVDGVVIRSGEVFRDGRNWKRVVFNQKG